MIKWKDSKSIATKSKNHDGWVKKIMVGRVCDKCGKEEEAYWGTVKRSRERRGEETDYCYRCSQIGRSMPKGVDCKKWKHGLTHNGYVRTTKDGKRKLEHVIVIEDYLGRPLKACETIHHIDMDKKNNCVENLYVFENQARHQKCHMSMEKCGFQLLGDRIWFDWINKRYAVTPQSLAPQFPKDYTLSTGKQFIDKYGYTLYNVKDESGRWKQRRLHILVAETILGRQLLRNECVHHVDGVKTNNDPSNLCVMTRSEHSRCHTALQKIVADLYKAQIVFFRDGLYSLELQGEIA